MKTILFKTIIIAFFVGTAVSCSDEDENRFRPGSTHEKPNPTEPEGGLDYSKLTADNHPRLLMNAEAFTALKAKVDANTSVNLTLLHNAIMGVCNSKGMNATALTYKLDASNKRILDVSRDALLRIFTCAYAYRMTGDAKYLTKSGNGYQRCLQLSRLELETPLSRCRRNGYGCCVRLRLALQRTKRSHPYKSGQRIVEVCLPTGTEQELESQLL